MEVDEAEAEPSKSVDAQKPAEAPKPVARAGSNGALKTEAAKSDAPAAASGKTEGDEAGGDSSDVKDLMKLLVRDAKKAAAQAVEPTASAPLCSGLPLFLEKAGRYLPICVYSQHMM